MQGCPADVRGRSGASPVVPVWECRFTHLQFLLNVLPKKKSVGGRGMPSCVPPRRPQAVHGRADAAKGCTTRRQGSQQGRAGAAPGIVTGSSRAWGSGDCGARTEGEGAWGGQADTGAAAAPAMQRRVVAPAFAKRGPAVGKAPLNPPSWSKTFHSTRSTGSLAVVVRQSRRRSGRRV